MFHASKYLVLVVVMITALCGCAAKQRINARLVVPRRCIRVNLSDFQKPCRAVSESMAVCDQVQIHYACMEVVK
jgi:hypothetical protein